MIPESPSRVNSNRISGLGIHVKNSKCIGSNLFVSSKANIPKAIVKDKSAELIVKKLINNSLTIFDMILIPKAVNKGKKTITKIKLSTI
tara:strand:- start:3658 stop:3924 length:267 start_codon:yes stop_codon:yes gene_type:complete